MENTQSIFKFKLTVLWTIICLSIMLFFMPNPAQAKKVLIPVLDLSQASESWARQWMVLNTAKDFAGGGKAGFYPGTVRSGHANPNPGRRGILYLHPTNEQMPARILRHVTLTGPAPILRIGVSGNRNVDGDWALLVKVNSKPLGRERIIRGSQGWYDLAFDLSAFSGQSVYIAIEARANNWHYEYAFFDYIQIIEKATEDSAPIREATNTRCDQYAKTAVSQNQENIRRRCGYTGARWSNNYQGHYDWCKRVSKAFADSETKAREDGLIKCRGGAGPATGAGVDWNNRPWLDPRVIRCVREYLDKWLIYANQQQRTKNEPPFTQIDDWGRALRPPYITATGGVDGNWDNPTHFVWGAYNTSAHINSPLGGVQGYVKECVRRGGGGLGPGPPGPQPQPGTNPWETPEGRACFEQWIREATAKMNAYNGSDDYNARKPWRINRYGILEGNPKYGPTSAYAPDNWSQYNSNRYWYMWDYWHAPSGVWGKPDLNAAGVPHIRPYILRCIAGYQQAQPPPQPPKQQALLTACYTGINRDVVGRGGQATPNGEKDGQFNLRLDTRGFRRVVNFIMLQSASAQGQPTGGQAWDTTPNQYWILGIYRNGRRLNPRDQNISDVVQGIVNYQIYGNDSDSFRPGQDFRITVRFADGGESVAYAKVTGTRPLAGVKPVPTTRDDEESPFDAAYEQFAQAQTSRTETRTQRVQEQMSIDSMFTASQGGSAGSFTQEGLTAQLDQTQTSQEQEGTTSTPESKCETVALNPGSWRQLQNNRGPLSQGQGGLVLHGDEWTNGKLKNGKFDGNGVESNKVFDLKNGGDVYMTFKVNDGGKYLAIFPKVFSEAGYKLLTTDHVWAGSVVVPNNTSLYAHIKVDTNGKYKTTVCKGSYDDKGGSRISDYNGTLKNTKGRVRIRFVDNYAGTKAYLVILKAEVCIPPKTAVAVAPPEPTKPPTTTTFRCKSNQDCWDHHKECNWYCIKDTGECFECRKKDQHGKRDGTEACCSGAKQYPNCLSRD